MELKEIRQELQKIWARLQNFTGGAITVEAEKARIFCLMALLLTKEEDDE